MKPKTVTLIWIVVFLLLIAAYLVYGQAPRPPVTSLNGLTDVTITSPANGQALIYNGATSQWNNTVVPNSALASLTDVILTSPTSGQFLRYSGSTWQNYGPINFTDLVGNITTSQMNNGSGATSTTYWRGDGTWASPPIGVVAATNNLLVGDGAGNAIDASTFGIAATSSTLAVSTSGNYIQYFAVQNTDTNIADATASAAVVVTAGTANLSLSMVGPGFVTSGINTANDAIIANDTGDINIYTKTSPQVIRFGNNNGTSASAVIGGGLTVGGTTDPGSGIINANTGFRIGNAAANGNYLRGNGTNFVSTSVPATNVVWLTTVGTATYTVTSGARAIYVECVGAGGGGGAVAGVSAQAAYSGGGSGGGYAALYITSPAATYSYTVGSGVGTGGAAGANSGTNGGNTTFGTGPLVTATGGLGGANMASAATAGTGAAGGTKSGGSGSGVVVANGGEGGYGLRISTAMGISGDGGQGGGPFGGGLTQGYKGSSSFTGRAGTQYGGGGSGAGTNLTTNLAGGDGGNGAIRVTEFF